MSDFAKDLDSICERFTNDSRAVDQSDSVPKNHFEELATLGLYGAFAPIDEGGLGRSLQELCAVVEQLASSCLATTFVWIQHFRLLASVIDQHAPRFLLDLKGKVIRGESRGGVALGGQLPGPAKLIATPTDDGWTLDGEAPWVSGWGIIDYLFVAARGPEDTVVSLLLPAIAQDGLAVSRHELSALNATATVRLDFSSLEVASERVIGRAPYDPTLETPQGLRLNGSLALGVARRCCGLLGPTLLDAELQDRRLELDTATGETMPLARARACELAVRASHALGVQRGSSSVLNGGVAERTAREAQLLLTFGSRPSIRQALLEEFGALERL